MIVVYSKERERALRAGIGEFEQATRAEGHDRVQTDATGWFAEWMAAHEYRDAYFEDSELLDGSLGSESRPFAIEKLSQALDAADGNTVVALLGTAPLYALYLAAHG